MTVDKDYKGDERFLYVGPSWAFQNFEHPDVEKTRTVTNLARQWKIPHIDLSTPGARILQKVDEILAHPRKDLPIVWVYGEPSFDIEKILKINDLEFIQRSDWKDLWRECNRYCLSKIYQLGRPVFLIGAHSDITDCYDNHNIVIGDPSWQRFIARNLGICDVENKISFEYKVKEKYDYIRFMFPMNYPEKIIIDEPCWGPDIVHKTIFHNPDVFPNHGMTDWVWKMLNFWKYLEEADQFYDTHPNYNSNVSFAKHLYPKVLDFLESVK